MHAVLAVAFSVMLVYLLVQFARQEEIQDEYQDAVIDVEARLEWALSRTTFPYGMKTQIERSGSLLCKAKLLWGQNHWHQAYRTARQSQEAIDKAQSIYSATVTAR